VVKSGRLQEESITSMPFSKPHPVTNGTSKDPARDQAGVMRMLTRTKNASLGQSVVSAAAIASEIEDHFKFGLKMELMILWQLMYEYIDLAREIFDTRHKALLSFDNT
jgi:hypothetical protein